jgi:hypothetical protein
MVDLMGWNMVDKTADVESDGGIEPQLTLRRMVNITVPTEDETRAQHISHLLHCLLGEKRMANVIDNPVQSLVRLGLGRQETAWVIAQLGLHNKCPEILGEINRLVHLTPEVMGRRVVAPTLGGLLNLGSE